MRLVKSKNRPFNKTKIFRSLDLKDGKMQKRLTGLLKKLSELTNYKDKLAIEKADLQTQINLL